MIRNISKLIKGSPQTQYARRKTLELLNIALNAVNPQHLIQHALKLQKRTLQLAGNKLPLDDINGIYIIGAGKATGRMAEGAETLLKDQISDGLVIVPEATINQYNLDTVQIQGGGHPNPNSNSITATQQLIDLVNQAPSNALILSLFSGGGSALLTLPSLPLTLQHLQQTTTLLLHQGLPIHQINIIRKHLSQVKGGQLATHIHPRHHWGLLISDVPGDFLDIIASGPTLPDPSTFSDVAALLDTHQLWAEIPNVVREHIKAGVQGKRQDTPKVGDPIFEHSTHYLIGNNHDACYAALTQARRDKFISRILTTDCQGEARKIGDKLGRLAQILANDPKPQVIIVGSETTVTVTHEGKGGRNMELVTAALPYLHGLKGLVLASLATDGIDGPTNAAGAIADGDSYHRAQFHNLLPQQLLENNNTYPLFQALEDLLFTGTTHTNVRDITILLHTGSPQ